MFVSAQNAQKLTQEAYGHILEVMKQLYTLAFPKLNPPDQIWIDRTREQNDSDFQKVRPHFTLLFGCTDVSMKVYSQHVASIVKATSAFEFQARRVSLGIDHFGTEGYAFLVPDEGHSNLLALHDRLYTGPLSPYLRPDLPYIPHITLGRRSNLQTAKLLCDKLNSEPISISGAIETLTVVEEKNGRVKELRQFTLLSDN